MSNTLTALIGLALAAVLFAWVMVTFEFWFRRTNGSKWGWLAWMMTALGAPALVAAVISDLVR